MGGSVGIGGLIIGISMLVVFSMAYQSINSQISSGLDRIDDAEQPIPTFAIDDATLWEGAVVGYTITTPGTLYTNGTLTTSTGGFAGTYTVDGGGTIIDVVITSHGNYSSAPTPTITCSTPCSSNSGNAAIGFTLGNAVHANFTNLGSTTIDFDEMWITWNGMYANQFSSYYTSTISSTNWYTGETLYLELIDPTLDPGNTRISMTVGPTSIGHVLA